MNDATPVVLIASVSSYEGLLVERALKRTGWTLLRVADASDAAKEIDGGQRPAVLVIDAGLLSAAHDGQWRTLRSRQLGLGTVVRCYKPQSVLQATDSKTLQVHPDDAQGMYEAIQSLL